MYYLEAGYGKHRRMRNAILAALVLHIAVLLSLSFSPENKRNYAPQIEVTLALRADKPNTDNASHIAAFDQSGDGDAADNPLPTSPNVDLQNQQPVPDQAMPQPPDSRVDPQRDAIATAAAARRRVPDTNPEDAKQSQLLEGISPEVDRLSQELAGLEAELDEQTRTYAELPRTRRLTSVSAKRAVDAAYLLDWRQRVEAVGNKYYPEASVRYGIYGSLRLLVVIRQDGSLEDIRVLSSSGFAVLDEAAIKIVRMAAPYAPFPAELRASTDRLEIIRTWQFQEDQLSSK
jgi:protein TonB